MLLYRIVADERIQSESKKGFPFHPHELFTELHPETLYSHLVTLLIIPV